jgi:hypothetical protein
VIDLADRPDVSPELRLVPHAFREAFGRSAEGVWYAPGVVPLLPGTWVCARWGAIVAGDRRTDGVLEIASINKPAEPVRTPARGFTGVNLPRWARPLGRLVELLEPGGVTLLCSVDLPAGSGLSSRNALVCAAALALRDLCQPDMPVDYLLDVLSRCTPHAVAAFEGFTSGVDLSDTGVLVVDTRVRRDRPVTVVDFPTSDCRSGEQLGRCLKTHHRAQHPDEEQDLAVGAALHAGAYGASMLVDEPGRPVVAVAEPRGLSAVRSRVSETFRETGLRGPRYLTVRPTAGAVRITA